MVSDLVYGTQELKHDVSFVSVLHGAILAAKFSDVESKLGPSANMASANHGVVELPMWNPL